MIERLIQYFKIEQQNVLMITILCNNNKLNCDLQNVYNWIRSFVYLYNTKIINTILSDIEDEIILS